MHYIFDNSYYQKFEKTDNYKQAGMITIGEFKKLKTNNFYNKKSRWHGTTKFYIDNTGYFYFAEAQDLRKNKEEVRAEKEIGNDENAVYMKYGVFSMFGKSDVPNNRYKWFKTEQDFYTWWNTDSTCLEFQQRHKHDKPVIKRKGLKKNAINNRKAVYRLPYLDIVNFSNYEYRELKLGWKLLNHWCNLVRNTKYFNNEINQQEIELHGLQNELEIIIKEYFNYLKGEIK